MLKAKPVPRRGPLDGEGAACGRGVRVGRNPVLRPMRLHGLLAPVRAAPRTWSARSCEEGRPLGDAWSRSANGCRPT